MGNNEEDSSYAINILFIDGYCSENTKNIEKNIDDCTILWRICIKGSQHFV